eukprot:153104-Prorocentrum_minimum.AAC.1
MRYLRLACKISTLLATSHRIIRTFYEKESENYGWLRWDCVMGWCHSIHVAQLFKPCGKGLAWQKQTNAHGSQAATLFSGKWPALRTSRSMAETCRSPPNEPTGIEDKRTKATREMTLKQKPRTGSPTSSRPQQSTTRPGNNTRPMCR